MEIGILLIVMTLTFYTSYLFGLINSKSRKEIRDTNVELDDLRKIPIKTLDEQKQFLKLRYNNKPFKFSVIKTFKLVIYIVILIFIYYCYSKMILYLSWEIYWWHGLLFLIFFPFILNKILGRFGLQRKGVKIF